MNNKKIKIKKNKAENKQIGVPIKFLFFKEKRLQFWDNIIYQFVDGVFQIPNSYPPTLFHSSLPLFLGDMFQDILRLPETLHSTKRYLFYPFFPKHTCL
jgi:hypothetical protein